jgi:hypothetical protein
MRRRKVLLVSGAVLAALLLVGALGATAVFAQEPEPETEAPPAWPFGGRRGFGRGGFGPRPFGHGPLGGAEGGPWERFDGLAEALGLTPEELFAELHDGKAVEEIAEAQGVDLEELREQMAAERTEAMRDAIEQAVEDGEMDPDRAEWLLEGLDKGYMPGFRLGARGFGRRWGPCPPADAEAESAAETSA